MSPETYFSGGHIVNTAGIVWLVIFAVAALTFFGVAVVVSVKGVGDLRHLLRSAQKREGDAA
jgi:hypothetical protein